ncbi:hypothetical protein DVS28_a2384 [Euzebya pacifica]|uniref:Uncharacterized protein n=1 Tax=Euzebya pacifica TaxID=1608957 RepID=A0A346XXW8_9ACTN|nr:hypothetical protein DVS28_a2384 [Euzebya pacifica]
MVSSATLVPGARNAGVGVLGRKTTRVTASSARTSAVWDRPDDLEETGIVQG